MFATREQRLQRNGRLFRIGLLLSLAVHVAALALVRIHIRLPDARETQWLATSLDSPPPLVELAREPLPPEPVDGGGGGATAAESALGDETLTWAANPTAVASVAFEALVVTDPATMAPIAPLDLDVPESEPEPAVAIAAAAASNGEAYTPGGVGSAKRRWAGEGEGNGRSGFANAVRIRIAGGPGICTLPGRSRGPYR